MSPITVIDWPNVRDCAKLLDVSTVYVNKLIHLGRLEAAHTRLGFLVNPASVAAFQAERQARKLRAERVAC